MDYDVVSLLERPDLYDEQDSICSEGWPEFMLHDPVTDRYWSEFMELFRDCQLMMIRNEEIMAVINTVPFNFTGPFEELPEEGWDWGVAKSVEDRKNGIEPNYLMGVQVVVSGKHKGKGLSYAAVAEMRRLASGKGLRLLLPARPSEKSRYPLIPIEEYVEWQNSEGLPFDGWLRVHVKSGGRIMGVCSKAMRIPGSIAQWKDWTGLDFPGSGHYIVPGALNPVLIDLQEDLGVYVEPNVWILYDGPKD